MSLAHELLSLWAPIMRAVELQSGSGGRFEITLDGELVFSKKASGRFPKPGEVAGLFEQKLGPPLQWRKAST
ncbi:MAG: Rdx family protein [Candidatus Dormibacteraeota bacterium]|nr:Rdx family protein [Candidatus Dormibacteraeota bacterium]